MSKSTGFWRRGSTTKYHLSYSSGYVVAALLLLSVFLSLFRVWASLTFCNLRAPHAICYSTMVNNNNNNSTNHVFSNSFMSDEEFVVTRFVRQNMSKLVRTMTTVVSSCPASPPIHTRLSDTKYFDKNHSFFDKCHGNLGARLTIVGFIWLLVDLGLMKFGI